MIQNISPYTAKNHRAQALKIIRARINTDMFLTGVMAPSDFVQFQKQFGETWVEKKLGYSVQIQDK